MRYRLRGIGVGCGLWLGGLGAWGADPPPMPPAAPMTPMAPMAVAPANVAATVNGEVIRLDEVDALLRRRPSADTPITANQLRRARQAILQDLVDDLLMQQYLRTNGPKVESTELDNHLRALAVSLQKQGRTLADYYRETGRTEAQLREHWTALVRFQKFVDQRCTEQDLRKHFEANRSSFDGTTIQVSHIVLRVSPGAPPGERTAARQKLANLRAEIMAGKIRFADAARKYSEDPSSRQGGEVGWISRHDPQVDDEFCRYAFELKPGEVSEPVDGEFGVHLITTLARKAGPNVAFEAVVDLVRESRAEEIRRDIVAHQKTTAQIQIALP